MPIGCHYLFSDGKISPFIELGVAPTFHIGGNNTYFAIQQELKVPSQANSFSLFLKGGCGIQVKMNETLNFILQPTMQYQILNLRQNTAGYPNGIFTKKRY